MKKKIALENWNRKEIFHFFKGFDEPFFGVTVNLDVSLAFDNAKKHKVSFFTYYLYAATRAANELAAFRYRIEDDEVWEYETLQVSAVISRDNGTFGFSYIPYHPDIQIFKENVATEILRVQSTEHLMPSKSGTNVIHFSSLPWLQFTGLSHARHFGFKDSVPKVSVGKVFEQNGQKMMPVSVHLHHALADGIDVANFINLFQQYVQL
jgi:chloramphenicol O-acetyltransferase type A